MASKKKNAENTAISSAAKEPCDVPETQQAIESIIRTEPGELNALQKHWTTISEQFSQQYGPNSEPCLFSRLCLSVVLYKQHKLRESLNIASDVYARGVRSQGAKHLDTLLTRQHIARVLMAQGKDVKALALLREACDGLKSINESTFEIREHMASLLEKQGKLGEALDMFKEIYEGRVATIGPNAQYTLCAQECIGSLLYSQGKCNEAMEIYKDVYKKRIIHFGADHQDTLGLKQAMALIYVKMGKKAEAKKLSAGVYEKLLNNFGPDHEDTISAQQVVAMKLSNEGKHKAALEIWQDVYDRRKRILGPNHRLTTTALSAIALEQLLLGKLMDGLKIVEDHCETNRPSQLALADSTAALRHLAARKLEKEGKLVEALNIYKQLYKRQLMHVGLDGKDTVAARTDVVRVLNLLGNKKEAFMVVLQGLCDATVD